MEIFNNRPLTENELQKIATPYIKNHAEEENYSQSKEVLNNFIQRNSEQLSRLGGLLNRVHK